MGRAPKFVALCGAPGSGKTTVAEFLVKRYGARLVDDGACLRDAVMAFYGLSWADVYTQEGKAKRLEVGGQDFTHRQLLGDMGNLLEGFYGQQLIPERAIARLSQEADDAPFYVFASVRKTQGITYRAHGGLVVEVVRPGHVPVNDFDLYDKSLLTHSLLNGRQSAADPFVDFFEDDVVIEPITQDEFLQKAATLFDGLGYQPIDRSVIS